ncbi:hypothetical protein EP331_11790 [bacterium]|nr:MAG: hypothetical protein EP331_11790 [bacterium]
MESMSTHRKLIYLNPGDVYATSKDYIIKTVLGSCIAVVVYDPILKVGGMNHIVLSESKLDTQHDAKYALFAMEKLEMKMKSLKSSYRDWVCFIIGGANQFENMKNTIGLSNAEIARNWLQKKQAKIRYQDIGGANGRVVLFEAMNGKIVVNPIRNHHKKSNNE